MLNTKQQEFALWDKGRDAQTVFLTTTAALTSYTMKASEHLVRIVTTALGAMAITLPPVVECAGGIYMVHLVTKVTSDVTIDDNADDAGLTQIDLDTTGQFVIFFCDGYAWHEILGLASAAGYS